MMLPIKIKKHIDELSFNSYRNEIEIKNALKQLSVMRINPKSEFGIFYTKVCAIDLVSNNKGRSSLVDICFPENVILMATKFAKEVCHLPEGYYCITSGEGGGFYIYRVSDEAVFNLNNSEIEKISEIAPNWKTFNIFMEWFLL